MHKNAFGGRAPPGPDGGAYSAPPKPLAGLKGEGKERGKREGEEMKKTEDPQCLKCVDAHAPNQHYDNYTYTACCCKWEAKPDLVVHRCDDVHKFAPSLSYHSHS